MALFSRRHYRVLADRLHLINRTIYNNECKFSWVVEQLADRLAEDNPAFDRKVFVEDILNTAEIKTWKVK